MKKPLSCLLACIFFLLNLHSSNAQGNFPFPNNYAEWHYRTVSPLIGPTDFFSHKREIMEGDSIFQGKIYQKVYSQLLCVCDCNTQNGSYTQPWSGQGKQLLGGVREEAGKVYFTNFGKPPFDAYFRPVGDTLLYDFTLNQWDTLNYDLGVQFTVIKVDFTNDGRRRLELFAQSGPIPKTVVWTEGIGYDYGLLNSSAFVKNYFYITGYSCFSTTNGVCPIPCALSSVSDAALPEELSLYPNFAEHELFLELGNGFDGIKGFVYTVDGRLITHLDAPGKLVNLNVSDWPKGMLYFVLERADGQTVARSYMR